MRLPINELLTQYLSVGLVVSLVTGLAFGFVLERAGFGRSTKLAGQFYLRDMTVFKVMFTAIVTAMIGLVIAGGLGVIEIESLARGGASYTYLWPMLVGGLVLGAGFIISGYCPGTSLVASASGHFDGMFTFAGVIIGSVLYGEIYPAISAFATSSNYEHLFLHELLGLPRAVVALGVTLMAIGAFFGAEKLERRFTTTEDIRQPSASFYKRRRTVMAALGAAAVVGLAFTFIGIPTSAATVDDRPRQITAEQLAHRVVEEPWRMRVLDLRGQEAWSEVRVPGSEPVDRRRLDDLGLQYVRDGVDLVLIGEETIERVDEQVATYDGRILALRGGFEAWQRYALTTPQPPPPTASEAEREQYSFRAALHSMVTGQAAAAPPPRPVRSVGPRRPTGGGGCS